MAGKGHQPFPFMCPAAKSVCPLVRNLNESLDEINFQALDLIAQNVEDVCHLCLLAHTLVLCIYVSFHFSPQSVLIA